MIGSLDLLVIVSGEWMDGNLIEKFHRSLVGRLTLQMLLLVQEDRACFRDILASYFTMGRSGDVPSIISVKSGKKSQVISILKGH